MTWAAQTRRTVRPLRRTARSGAVLALVVMLAGGLPGVAGALPTPLPGEPQVHGPDQGAVDEAREAERRADSAAEQAEVALAEVAERLLELEVAAAVAVEGANAARIELAEAQEDEAEARAAAADAAAAVEEARRQLGRLAAASYRSGGELATVGLVLDAEGEREVLDLARVLRSATSSRVVALGRWRVAGVEAETAAAAASDAAARTAAAAAAAEEQAAAADQAVAEQRAAIAEAEAERDRLLAELAAARETTVQLERERQEALAAVAARQRELDARRAAEQAAREAAEAEAADAVESADAGSGTAPPEAAPPSSGTAGPITYGNHDTPEGAAAAVAWARTQIGKPYGWGRSGPDAYDCSGLTMRAWERGGVSLQHWSVAQARAVTRVPYGELLPGDLVFWSTNGQASGVYHVGLYVGDGQMIHAPRAGKPVEQQSVFYWVTPAFYGRV
jgi:peptidoglycan DL-endopeptidase CwlO